MSPTPSPVRSTTSCEKVTPARPGGRCPRPGVARVYAYPDAAGDRVIADVVRLDKGHTEGLEPNITRTLLELIVAAPGGKLREAGCG